MPSAEIIGTDEFRDWYLSLPQEGRDKVEFVVDLG